MALIEVKKVFVKTGMSHFRIEFRVKDSDNFKEPLFWQDWIDNVRWIYNDVRIMADQMKQKLESIGYKYIEFYKVVSPRRDGMQDGVMIRMSDDGSSLTGHMTGDLHAPFCDAVADLLKEMSITIEEEK